MHRGAPLKETAIACLAGQLAFSANWKTARNPHPLFARTGSWRPSSSVLGPWFVAACYYNHQFPIHLLLKASRAHLHLGLSTLGVSWVTVPTLQSDIPSQAGA